MRKAKNIFANIDSISVFLYIALMFFGWVNIYASQYNEDVTFALDFSSRYGKQFLFIAIALVIAANMAFTQLKKPDDNPVEDYFESRNK